MAIRVLFVDTDARRTEKICNELRHSGMDPSYVATAGEALQFLQVHEPDVMVLDAGMPWLGSGTILESVKSASPLVEVIVSVTHDRRDLAVEAMHLGACDHIVKPMRISELVAKIRNAGKLKAAQEMKIERASLERMVMLTERR